MQKKIVDGTSTCTIVTPIEKTIHTRFDKALAIFSDKEKIAQINKKKKKLPLEKFCLDIYIICRNSAHREAYDRVYAYFKATSQSHQKLINEKIKQLKSNVLFGNLFPTSS